MSNLFNMARVEAQDSSGGVLAGAKLEFFETGTSTNLDTYSNDTLVTANANPVVADSAGRWGAIFLRDAKYKVTLSDSADVQIWSADPVDGGLDNIADDTIRSTLATTGSANAYALTVNRVITAYANGDTFVAKANFENTDSATLNITGGQSGASALGAKTIKKNHDINLGSGDIENGQWCVFRYDGTNMQLLSPVATVVNVAKNFIINGDFRIVQRGTSFISTTTPANNDDTYLLDHWVLLSDGNDVVDVTQGTDGSVGNGTYLQADVETINKKFGFLTILENEDTQDILSESDVVSLSCNILVSDAAKLSRIKMMIASWTSTADSPTSDIVNSWGAEGTSPTVVTNWTIEGDSGDLGVTASDVRYSLENVSIDASGVNNIAVFIWSDDVATNDTLGTLLKITNVKLEKGAVATDYVARAKGQELALCQRYYQKTFAQSVAPAQNAGTGGSIGYRVAVAGVINQSITIRYPVVMRVTPTITFYNPSAANALWRNNNDAADSGAATVDFNADSGFIARCAQAAGDDAGEQIHIHYQADAEL